MAVAHRIAVTLLVLLCVGLVPVWALSLQTPFRLIDDYGAAFHVWDRSPWDHEIGRAHV